MLIYVHLWFSHSPTDTSRVNQPALSSAESDWVVFDLETTGLSPEWDQIIQIAAVRMRGGRVLAGDSFFSYVDPQRRIPSWISQYTGVRDADVRNAPTAAQMLPDFSRFVGGATLVAHNGHRFDMKFLAASCTRERLPVRTVYYHDSLSLSWKLWGRRGRHGMDAVLDRLNLSCTGVRRHDARGDVELLARAIELMRERLDGAGVDAGLTRYEGALPRVV